ncbi:hypothetical protein ACU61A_42185 [Pseudonocardia sichuanensis]
MFHWPSTVRSEHAAAAFAAGATVAIAVMAHLVTGDDPVRFATLAVVVALIGVVRVRSAGRQGIILSCLSSALVAQPTLHAVSRLLPAESAAHGPDLSHAATDFSISGVHLLLTALLVAALVGAEQAFLLLVALQPFARWLRLLTSSFDPPSPVRVGTTCPKGLAVCWSPAPQVLRRGPPVPARVVG